MDIPTATIQSGVNILYAGKGSPIELFVWKPFHLRHFSVSWNNAPVPGAHEQGRRQHRHAQEETRRANHQNSVDAAQDLQPLSTIEGFPPALRARHTLPFRLNLALGMHYHYWIKTSKTQHTTVSQIKIAYSIAHSAA